MKYEDLMLLFGSADPDDRVQALSQEDCPDELVLQGLSDQDPSVFNRALLCLGGSSYMLRQAAMETVAVEAVALNGIEDPDVYVQIAAVNGPGSSELVLLRALEVAEAADSRISELGTAVLLHPNATEAMAILGMQDERMRNAALFGPGATEAIALTGVVNYAEPSTRRSALSGPGATEAVAMLGVVDSDVSVRIATLSGPGATEAVAMLGVVDSDVSVRIAALSGPGATEAVAMLGIEDADFSVQEAALSGPGLTQEVSLRGLTTVAARNDPTLDAGRDDFGYQVGGVMCPAFPGEVFSLEVWTDIVNSEEDVSRIEAAVRSFSQLGLEVRDQCAQLAWQHFQWFVEISTLGAEDEGMPTSIEEIWGSVLVFGFASSLVVESEDVFVVVNTSPAWEEEHGMNFVFRNGKSLIGANSNGEGAQIDMRWPITDPS